jgi:uncharacterized repeat protein (TIGR01451 family)
LTATTSGGFLFTGEGIDAFPDLGFIPPSGASETPAPVFTRTSGFSIDVSGVPLADLSVAKQDSPEPVAAGDPLVYSIIVTNHGPDGTGADVIVVDTLPEGVTYLSDTSAAGCTEAPTGTLTCRLANLAADESKQIDVTVMLDRAVVFNAGNPILISNTAQASSLAPDPDLTNNSATEETLVVAVADLKIVSLEAVDPPTEILVGEDVDITLRTAITNLGPSAPMDVELTRTATAPPDSTVTPSAPPPALEQALAFQEVRTVDEVFTINCSQPSMHTFIFTNEIQPFRKYADPSLPDDSDPKQDNNQTELNVNIECVVPVAINIHPGGFPNPINPGKGSATVAVLTTDAGEYGLPLAFDATTIDPLSVRFDSAKGLEGSYTAAEIHNQGHIQDSIERQLDSRGRESVTDGDQDMVLHFRVSDTSIDDDTAEACVKGEWIDVGGVVHKFFGCDSVNIVAQR